MRAVGLDSSKRKDKERAAEGDKGERDSTMNKDSTAKLTESPILLQMTREESSVGRGEVERGEMTRTPM